MLGFAAGLRPALRYPVGEWVGRPLVTLDFGGCAPDSVSLRYWSDACWGDTEAQAETLSAQRQDNGTYTVELIPSVGIFAVDASWDADDYQGAATYVFCTKAA